MEKSVLKMARAKHRRALRVRKHVRGNATQPRMCVVKSNKHIQVQLINDDAGHTLASISTFAKEMKGATQGKNKESARVLGAKIAEKAKALGINQVIFDRGPFKYHGILAALADAARESGLEF